MAGGFHSTRPLNHSVAFVASVTSKLPSALEGVSWQRVHSIDRVGTKMIIASTAPQGDWARERGRAGGRGRSQ